MGQYYPPQGGYQQQGYGQPGFGGPLPDHPQAQTVFILALVGLAVGICAPIAWYMGAQAKKEIAAGAPYNPRGNLHAGYMIGKILTIVGVVALGLWVGFMALLLAAGSTSS